MLNGLDSMRTTTTLWIIHRDSLQRGALARISGAGEDTILGAPSDALFESASLPDVVLLAPSGDFETELEFVHRFSPRLPKCHWIILAAGDDLDEARRLFNSLPAEFLRYPPHPDRLRSQIHHAIHRRNVDSLSRRRKRDRLASRFSRWFADLELPDLLRAVDPRLSHLPLLIRGESGTGRGLLARYVHSFGSSDESALHHVPCPGIARETDLMEMITGGTAGAHEWSRTIWLDDVDCLSLALQSRVRDWIEYGPPEGSLQCTRVRWIASAREELDYAAEAGEPQLTHGLSDSLSGLSLQIPPLRERAQTIEPFTADTALAWSNAHGERARRFSDDAMEVLSNHPWPGNMTELETVVQRTLALTSADPIESFHLRFQRGEANWNREASNEPFITAEPLPDPPLTDQADREATILDWDADASASLSALDPSEAADGQLPSSLTLGTPPTSRPAPPEPPTPSTGDQSLRRLVGALAHEVRNPLVSIRTFSQLLPEHFEDSQFRDRFAELVGSDVQRIESVVAQLEALADLDSGRPEPVDIAALLDESLKAEEAQIQSRGLLVLKELDRSEPYALGNPEQIRRAFAALISKSLTLVPEHGDVYLASKHNASGLRGQPTVRILLRYHNPTIPRPRGASLDEGFRIEGVSEAETSLDFVIAEALIRAQHGSLTLDTTDAQETLIVVDLPAPDPFA